MKKSIIFSIVAVLSISAGFRAYAQEPEYVATPVTVSTEKVRGDDGQLYYSHIVLEKQTLFSIAKAYEVAVDDIYDANPGLKEEGLKALQIIRIPIKAVQDEVRSIKDNVKGKVKEEIVEVKATAEKVITHVVKWFEDLNSIAKKYGISKEAIMTANGMKSEAVSSRQVLRIPLFSGNGGSTEEVPEPVEETTEATAETVTAAPEEKETIEENEKEGIFDIFFGPKKDITAALILPFNASKSPSDNNLDFYSGVLLAVRDLKNEGINVDLSVYDSTDGTAPVTEEKLSRCDIVLGPVSPQDLAKTLDLCSESVPVVSPLDQKGLELATAHPNFIQAPSPSEEQAKDLVNWVGRQTRHSDRVVLLKERGKTPTGQAANVIRFLDESGLEYSTVEFGVLDNSNIADRIVQGAGENSVVRAIIASESEAFLNDAIRFANLAAHRKNNIEVYCTSKIRSFDTIEIENLHSTKLHVSISYFIDYDDKAVQSFLMSYRALFGTEPGPFAFQGYDTAYTFLKAISQYGRRWMNNLEGKTFKGLQSDFRFTEIENGGYVNTAIRRIVYGRDFSVRLEN